MVVMPAALACAAFQGEADEVASASAAAEALRATSAAQS